jgi:pSer/pThr/pTyr-binding forkhead associated (FHA) protein
MESLLNARLVGIGGPVEGVFGLADEEISIGRGHANSLPIEDASVSKRHCSIRKLAADRFEIRDLGSRNGTAVNGLPVTERVLRDRDEIRLGECRFLFLLGESNTSSNAIPVQFDQGLNTRTLCRFRQEDSTLTLVPLLDEPAAYFRSSGSLAVLLKLGAAFMARGTEQIARQLLNVL